MVTSGAQYVGQRLHELADGRDLAVLRDTRRVEDAAQLLGCRQRDELAAVTLVQGPRNALELLAKMNPVITVLIADDHPIFRAGLRQIIEAGAAVRVVAEAGSDLRLPASIEKCELGVTQRASSTSTNVNDDSITRGSRSPHELSKLREALEQPRQRRILG